MKLVLYAAVLGCCTAAIVQDAVQAGKTTSCEFFDPLCAKEAADDRSCYGSRDCYEQPEAEPGKEAFCFTVWQNGTGSTADQLKIKRQGCVFNHGSSQVTIVQYLVEY